MPRAQRTGGVLDHGVVDKAFQLSDIAREIVRAETIVDRGVHIGPVSSQFRRGAINKVIESSMKDFRPPVKVKGRPRIYYGTQIDVNPPTLMLFVNDPRIFSSGYRRFLENRLREALPFKEIPLRIIYKRRRSIFAKDRK